MRNSILVDTSSGDLNKARTKYTGNTTFSIQSLGVIDVLGAKTLERINLNQLHESVQFLISLLILVTLSRKAHANTGRWVLDSCGPQVLIQVRVNADILRSHGLGRKGANLLDSTWGLLLELASVNSLGEVDGVVASDQIRLASLNHLCRYLFDR